MGMVDLQRMVTVTSTPRATLDEAAFQRLKQEDFRRPTLTIASAGAVLVFSLWLWDWAIDAHHAPDTFWLRILLAASILTYPLAILAGVRRWLPLAFYAMLLWLQLVFMLILARLEGGAVHGMAGFLFWFIVPPLMSFILRLRDNMLGNFAVLAGPSLLAGPLGMLPEMDLIRINALLVPACGITIVGHVMVDRLLRRIYDYRWQLEWRSVAIDALAEGVVIIQEGLIRYANQAAAALAGRRPQEIVGAPLADYVRIDETTDLGQPLRVEAPGGRAAWIRAGRSAILWQGKPATLVSVADITEQLRADEALRSSEQRYRLLVDHASEGILISQEGILRFVNPRIAELAGRGVEALTGQPLLGFIHPDDHPVLIERFKRRRRGETVPQHEVFRLQRPDGGIVWIEFSGVDVEWEGRPAVLSFLIDITERKRVEDELRRSEANYRSVIESSPIGVAILHRNRMMLVNHALCRMLDGSEAELLAQGSFIDLVCEEDRDMMRAHADHIAHEPEGGKALVAFRIRTLQGRRIWVEGNTVQVEWQGWPATLSFIHDVTERRRLEENLKQTLAERETILDRSIVGIAFLDPKGRMRWANSSMVRIFGLDMDAIVGQSLEHYYESREAYRATGAAVSAAVLAGKGFETELRMRRADGSLFWAHLSGKAVNPNDLAQGTVWAVLDIDQRKRLEEDLQRTSSEREAILQSTLVGITFAAHRRHQWVNRRFSEMLGYEPEELVGQLSLIHFPDEASWRRFGEAAYPLLAQGQSYHVEMPMRRKDGSTIWVEIFGTAIDPADLGKGTIWTYLDVTERHDLEDQLRRTSAEREAILQSALVGIIYSKDRNNEWVNRTFANMTGYQVEELIGQSSRLHFPSEESWRRFGEEAYAVLERGEAFSSEWQLVRRDGTRFWVHVFCQSVEPANPRQGTILTLVDITSRKQAEQDIREALEQQKELNQLKSRFVSMTSHEFRTPLAAILSSSELLKYYGERLPAEEKAELVDGIGQSVRRMTHMLDDVLTIGRAEADRLGFAPTRLPLRPLCAGLVEEALRADMAERGHHGRIEFRMDGGEVEAMLDEKLMRHILGNLLSNALKYSPEGQPVNFTVETDEANLRFTVEDRGIGIPADDLPRLFESFHRARNVGNISGTGLGLAIVKKAVELHGGRIEVDSRPGAGSRFTITLERKP
jgi:PAS domain S-box-containing protein